MTANRKTAEKAVSALGGSIDWDVSVITRAEKHIVVDSPAGHLWDYSGAEVIVVSWYDGTAGEFWAEVIDRVTEGVTPE